MSKNKKRLLIILLVLLLLLLALWAGGSYLWQDKEEEPVVNENVNVVIEEEEEDEDVVERKMWEDVLGWENCRTVDADLYGPGVYEYELANNDSILLVLCRVGGTSNTYRVYHYDKTVQEASRLEIDLYEAYPGGTRMAKYETFASIEDYSDFSTTGTSLRIHDRSNGLTTCGIDGTYEWNDGIKNYEIKSFKGNLNCDEPIEEENWPVLY